MKLSAQKTKNKFKMEIFDPEQKELFKSKHTLNQVAFTSKDILPSACNMIVTDEN